MNLRDALEKKKAGEPHDSVGLRMIEQAKAKGLKPTVTKEEFVAVAETAEFDGFAYHIDYVCKTFVNDFMTKDGQDHRDKEKMKNWLGRLLSGIIPFRSEFDALAEAIYADDSKESTNEGTKESEAEKGPAEKAGKGSQKRQGARKNTAGKDAGTGKKAE